MKKTTKAKTKTKAAKKKETPPATPESPKPSIAPVAPQTAAQAAAEAASPDKTAAAIPHPENLATPDHSVECRNCGFVYAGKDYCNNCGVDL